jgi:hypothetical protein
MDSLLPRFLECIGLFSGSAEWKHRQMSTLSDKRLRWLCAQKERCFPGIEKSLFVGELS